MRTGCILLLLLLLINCKGKKNAFTSVPDKPGKAINDTQFLERVIADTPYPFYHAVYIDSNRNADNYNFITDFSFTTSENLDYYLNDFKKRKIRMTPIASPDLPNEWIPLYLYKNKYYVYEPSEAGALCRRILNDSLLVFWFMDGPMPYVVRSITKTGKQSWQVQTKDYIIQEEGYVRPEILHIYMIDPVKKIAVWEYKSQNGKQYNYELVVAKESAKEFDIIINYCATNKMLEFEFDQPDFARLVKQFR